MEEIVPKRKDASRRGWLVGLLMRLVEISDYEFFRLLIVELPKMKDETSRED